MARILIISSQVAHGFIGGTVSQFVLQRLGYEVVLAPTILLSNHPGHKLFAGRQIEPLLLREMIEAMDGERQSGA